MWQAAGTGARGDPEPHAVGRGVQSRGTARASQSPFPAFIDSIVDRRSMRSASALSRARAESWSCRGAADPCLRAGTFQPQDSVPSCVVTAPGPNPQSLPQPPMSEPLARRGRQRRRPRSGARRVFWDGRRRMNRGSLRARERCGAEGGPSPGSPEWRRSVQGSRGTAGAHESPGQVVI